MIPDIVPSDLVEPLALIAILCVVAVAGLALAAVFGVVHIVPPNEFDAELARRQAISDAQRERRERE